MKKKFAIKKHNVISLAITLLIMVSIGVGVYFNSIKADENTQTSENVEDLILTLKESIGVLAVNYNQDLKTLEDLIKENGSVKERNVLVNKINSYKKTIEEIDKGLVILDKNYTQFYTLNERSSIANNEITEKTLNALQYDSYQYDIGTFVDLITDSTINQTATATLSEEELMAIRLYCNEVKEDHKEQGNDLLENVVINVSQNPDYKKLIELIPDESRELFYLSLSRGIDNYSEQDDINILNARSEVLASEYLRTASVSNEEPINLSGPDISSIDFDIYQIIANELNNNGELSETTGLIAYLYSSGNIEDALLLLNMKNELDGVKITVANKGRDKFFSGLSSIKEQFKENFINKLYRTSLSINPNTGHSEYFSRIIEVLPNGNTMQIGYMSFDPVTRNFDATLPIRFGNKKVTFYSEPRVGDVYVEYTKTNEDGTGSVPLGGKKGIVELMSVSLSSSGNVGGSFKLFNRLFAYNPNSKSFEMPIKINHNSTVIIDTRGNIRGNIKLFGSNVSSTNGSLFFDRNGNIGLSLSYRTGSDKDYLGSVNVTKDGDISGSIDLGRAIGMSSVFVGFGQGGITGVDIPIGSIAGQSFGIGIGKDGSLSFGGFVSVGPLPIPIGIGQDADGGFQLSWPGGSIALFGGDDRPLYPPELNMTDDGNNIKADLIYFRHSFKKAFKTVRVYQVPGETIEKDEQIERGNMIFKVYNELLNRNPSQEEFMNWYFYSGHELYKFPKHNEKDYRMSQTEKVLRRSITKGSGKAVQAKYRFYNNREYKWIQEGKEEGKKPKTVPTELLLANPFDDGSLEQSTDAVEVVSDSAYSKLLVAIEESAKEDKDFLQFYDINLEDVSIEDDIQTEEQKEEDSVGQQTDSVQEAIETTDEDQQSEDDNITKVDNDSAYEQDVLPSLDSADIQISEDSSKSDDVNQRAEIINRASYGFLKISKDYNNEKLAEEIKTVEKIDQSKEELILERKTLSKQIIRITADIISAEEEIGRLLEKLDERNSVLEILVGPDYDALDELELYKNENEVRIKQLKLIQENLSDKQSKQEINSSILSVSNENDNLTNTINQKRYKSSIFGGFRRMYRNILN